MTGDSSWATFNIIGCVDQRCKCGLFFSRNNNRKEKIDQVYIVMLSEDPLHSALSEKVHGEGLPLTTQAWQVITFDVGNEGVRPRVSSHVPEHVAKNQSLPVFRLRVLVTCTQPEK